MSITMGAHDTLLYIKGRLAGYIDYRSGLFKNEESNG